MEAFYVSTAWEMGFMIYYSDSRDPQIIFDTTTKESIIISWKYVHSWTTRDKDGLFKKQEVNLSPNKQLAIESIFSRNILVGT